MIYSIYKTKKKMLGSPLWKLSSDPHIFSYATDEWREQKRKTKKVNLGACGPRNYKYKFLCQLQIFKYKGNKGH